MMGIVESLNVSVATAVILFEAQRQRLKSGLYDQIRLESDVYHQLLFEWGYPKMAKLYRQQDKITPN